MGKKIVKVYKINKSYVVVIPKHVVKELEVDEKMLFEVKVEGGRIIYDPL
jgi:antitoxin component of MazEF toxin-antitoxin module